MTMKKLSSEETYEYICDGCERLVVTKAEHREVPDGWQEFCFQRIHTQSKNSYCGDLPGYINIHICSPDCMNGAMIKMGNLLLAAEKECWEKITG